MDETVQLISNVGFPIVACGYLARRNDQLTGIISDLKVTLTEIKEELRRSNNE